MVNLRKLEMPHYCTSRQHNIPSTFPLQLGNSARFSRRKVKYQPRPTSVGVGLGFTNQIHFLVYKKKKSSTRFQLNNTMNNQAAPVCSVSRGRGPRNELRVEQEQDVQQEHNMFGGMYLYKDNRLN